MATYSATLKDGSGNPLLPKTRSTLVECDNGQTVEAALASKQDTLTIDSALSSTSENPVQNKAIDAEFDSVAYHEESESETTSDEAIVIAAGAKGDKGDAGVGISSVEQTTTSTAAGGTNVITVTKTDGTTSTFNVMNGNNVGDGIEVVQETGTSTTDVMSQNAATEAFAIAEETGRREAIVLDGQTSDLYVPLSDKQASLMEAEDTLTFEICGHVKGDINNYRKDSSMWYFFMNIGGNIFIYTRYDGYLQYTGDNDTYTHVYNSTDDVWVQTYVNYYRFFITVNRTTGELTVMHRPGDVIATKTSDCFKSDKWLTYFNGLAFSATSAELWGVRIYAGDLTHSSFYKNNDHANVIVHWFNDQNLPHGYPVWSDTYDVNDTTIDWLTRTTRPYRLPSDATYGHQDDGYHIVYPTSGSDVCYANYGSVYGYSWYAWCVATIEFEVLSGSLCFNVSNYKTELIALVDASGNSYTANDTVGEGTYTITIHPVNASFFASTAEANTEVRLISATIHPTRCVFDLDPTVYHNKSIYDPVTKQWYGTHFKGMGDLGSATATRVDNPTKSFVFSQSDCKSVAAPNKAYPSRNGEIKVDDSGTVYVGVVTGTTCVWKQINNS